MLSTNNIFSKSNHLLFSTIEKRSGIQIVRRLKGPRPVLKSHFGRGVIDIIGSLCACYIIIIISKLLEIIKVSKIIERIGKESLLILCVHIIDLTFIPWDSIITINNMILLKQQSIILFKALGRVIFDTGFAMLLSKSKLLKKFF